MTEIYHNEIDPIVKNSIDKKVILVPSFKLTIFILLNIFSQFLWCCWKHCPYGTHRKLYCSVKMMNLCYYELILLLEIGQFENNLEFKAMHVDST